MELDKQIRRLREKLGLSQSDIARKLDVTPSTISNWESGKARPRLDKMSQLADLLNVTVSELMGEPGMDLPRPAESVQLPVAVAGHAGEFTEEPEPGEVVDVPVSVMERIADPDAYIIRIRGNCMSRRFPDGSNAIASPRAEPRNGDAVVAEYNGELIVREFFRGASTLVLSPDSYDDCFEDIVFDDPDTDTVSFQGVIKWYQASRVRRY